jgi:hypothetical protein
MSSVPDTLEWKIVEAFRDGLSDTFGLPADKLSLDTKGYYEGGEEIRAGVPDEPYLLIQLTTGPSIQQSRPSEYYDSGTAQRVTRALASASLTLSGRGRKTHDWLTGIAVRYGDLDCPFAVLSPGDIRDVPTMREGEHRQARYEIDVPIQLSIVLEDDPAPFVVAEDIEADVTIDGNDFIVTQDL